MICRVASSPLSVGIAMSMTTTSGRCFLASCTAWRPVSASPTIVMSGSASRRTRRPWRTTVWSSTNRIRIFSITIPCFRVSLFNPLFPGGGGLSGVAALLAASGQSHSSARVERNHHPNRGSFAGLRLDREFTVDQPDAFLHAQQAEALLASGGIPPPFPKRFPIIGHLHANASPNFADGDLNPAGPGMLGDVGQAFLGDAEQNRFLLATEFFGDAVDAKVNAQAGAIGKPFQVG